MTLGKRDMHKLETRDALIRAGEELFSKHGFHATTVASIAELAGVTERTFFRYFESKEDLVSSDVSRWLKTLEQCLMEISPDTPPFVALERAVLKALDHPGPIAGWLLPIGPDDKSTRKINATSGIALQVAEMIQHWSESRPKMPTSRLHPTASQRINDRFYAAVVARTGVAIVRTAITTATQQAALENKTASIDDIKQCVRAGFGIISSTT